MIRSLLRRSPSARNLAAALALTSGLLLVSAPSALALSKHVFSTSFAGSGTNALSNPSDVEVDQGTGDVYVTDPANHRVEKFTSTGEFILMFGKGVDATTGGDVCTAASGDVCQAGVKGSLPGGFDGEFETYAVIGGTAEPITGERLFLAVDNSGGPSNGDVYVGDPGDVLVQKFDSTGNLITSWGNGGQLDGAAEHEKKFYPFRLNGVAVDPSGTLYVYAGHFELFEFAQDGTPTKTLYPFPLVTDIEGIDADSGRDLYAPAYGGAIKYDSNGQEIGVIGEGGEGQVKGLRIDPSSRDLYLTHFHATEHDGFVEHFAAGCNPIGAPCESAESFGGGTLDEPLGVAIDDQTGSAYVADTGNGRVAVFSAVPYLPDATASAEALTPTSEALRGKADPAGAGPITACHFQYVTEGAFKKEAFSDLNSGGSVPCAEGQSLPSATEVDAELTGLTYGSEYHYRLALENAAGTNVSFDQSFESLPLAPTLEAESVSNVNSDTARIHALINANGGDSTYQTTYHVEYVTQEGFEAGEFAEASQSQSSSAGSARTPQGTTVQLSSLSADTTYHYRVVAENASGTVKGIPRTFTTFPTATPTTDPCPNAHVRQQTGAVRLLDCRAYELVSAANTGGYDVESSLIAGQSPFPGYPEAEGRVLYGVHNGGIPGTDHPTNKGLDPYIATRGEGGWTTAYEGVPANNPYSAAPFSSTPSGASADLGTLAFGAPGGCSPCFEGGYTGIPLRKANGELTNGMLGAEDPGPAAKAEGAIAKPLSADGTHFVFGSSSKFAADGNEGEVSIYDRNLNTNETKVISKTPAGATMSGPGIAELDISSDGSHILIGQLASEEDANKLYHLYLSVGDSGKTIDLTPGASKGALYAGMSSDGSKVFFTTKDQLLAEDEDESSDLYVAEVSGESAGLTLISTGSEGTGNTDSCEPFANSAHEHWNTKGGGANCDVVAIGGGGGVAAEEGSVYLLSPEKLDGSGNGTQDAPNLYVARPADGYTPRFVASLESVVSGPQPPAQQHSFDRSFGSFGEASGIAVDHADGSVYVLDIETNTVQKFDSSGNLVTSFGDTSPAHDGKLSGVKTPEGSFAEIASTGPTQLAVDNDPSSPSFGDLYVPDIIHSVVDKFNPEGEYEGQVPVSFPVGVAVNQANGHLYVASFFGHAEAFDANGNPVAPASFEIPAFVPSAIAVDSSGTTYVASGEGTAIYDSTGTKVGTLDAKASTGVSVDSSNGDVYVNEGSRVIQFSSSGQQLTITGAGKLSHSSGTAVDPGGELYAVNAGGKSVAVFLPPALIPDPRIDNPAVVDSVSEPGARHTADFQVTPSGNYAAFGSTLALGGGEEEPAGHSEVYRYTSQSAGLDCVSCSKTGAPSAADSSLARGGLSLLEDGRVFFDSTDQLVNSDTDQRQDAYEFSEPGQGNCTNQSPAYAKSSGTCLALISAGTSPFDSGLLTATANGKDAYFFTRDSLAPQDENGPTMKIYDAREGGGFPYATPAVPCQASDECHGAASPAPGPVNVGSVAGTPGNVTKKKCKAGFVKRHGRCVRKHHHHHKKHHRRADHKRGGAK
ncbi:MAG: hypothetical protein H0X42_04250 [Solirubrobacterales bacterium]|nr:hypothetical protein [Solirubrobacterales bacterium]